MGASRRGEREPGKSDQIDALAIARAVVKDGVERFPAAYLDEDAMEVRLLADHRRDLVAERTRAQNRLRWHLLELCPELERSLGRGSLEQPRQLDRIDRRLRRMTARARVRVAREQVARIRVLTRQADALQRELLGLIEAQRPQLIAETGCGTLTAAILIGRTAGAERFRTDASFARQTGTAPIPCSTGQRDRHRLDRGGDRQLNHAQHIIAITRARYDPDTNAYLSRANEPRAKPRRAHSAASNATSPDASTTSSRSLPKAHKTSGRSPPDHNNTAPRPPAPHRHRCPALPRDNPAPSEHRLT
jgi:transposase